MIIKRTKHIAIAVALLMIANSCAMKVTEYGVAIPVAYDRNRQQWSVLLGLQNNVWRPFSDQRQRGEKANIAAQRALVQGTNGVYNVTISRVPWAKIDGAFLHFVPVRYTPGRQLYETARSQAVTDFVWVPAQNLMQRGPVTPHPRKKQIVDPSFLQKFQHVWPSKQGELTRLLQLQPTPTKPQKGPWSEYAPQATSWQIPGAIYFYDRGKPYYEFTNFYERGVSIDNKVWPTTEQYYQAMKFTDPRIQETIRGFRTARQAFEYAQQNKNLVRDDWRKISLGVMEKAVHAKFHKNKDLQQMLLGTGNAVLVEDAKHRDDFYGAGADYKGQNHLGRILMKIRDELRGGGPKKK